MKRVTFRSFTLLFFFFLLSFNLVRLLSPDIHGFLAFLTLHPLWFYLPLISTYLGLSMVLAFFPCSGFHHQPVICRGETTNKEVSITFDDGPDPVITPKILDLLKTHGIQATFFIIGKRIEGNEELIKRIDNEGHSIGNHSFSHTNLWDFWTPGNMRRDLLQTERQIEQIIGKKVTLFRPPYGVINPMVERALRLSSYRVVAWSRRSFDTLAKNRERLVARVSQNLQPGEIILLHDTQSITVSALPEIIESIHAQQFRIVSLEQMIKPTAHA